MEFIQREDGYFISKCGRFTIPNIPGNSSFDRIQAYQDEGNEIIDGEITIPDDWQKPEPVIEETPEEPIEDPQDPVE